MSEQPDALRLADGMRAEAIRLADTLPRAMPSLESAVWGQRAAAELRRLHAENSALAAGQCTEGGPWGDEGGTPYCKLKEVNRELVEALEEIHEEPFDGNDVCRIARVALAKAKGESNE